MYRTVFQRDAFAELGRLQRQLQQAFDTSPGMRSPARGGFPAINVGSSPGAVEIACFAPGIDPDGIEVQLEKGVLTIAGERKADAVSKDEQANAHISERFNGRFRRVVTLPDDVDANSISAKYRDGVLHISAQRREAAQPRPITVQ